jgi:DNA-binding NarL/FixJ family response regulator
MSISISSSLPITPAAAPNSSLSTAAAPNVQQPANNSGDTIILSESQEVYQLYRQGLSVAQIASSLSLPVETVNDYLNISA